QLFLPSMKFVVLVVAAAALIGCLLRWLVRVFPRGVALRPVLCPFADLQAHMQLDQPNSMRWYVESTQPFDGRPYSCSFVEFDERGDYLDFQQHRHSYEK